MFLFTLDISFKGHFTSWMDNDRLTHHRCLWLQSLKNNPRYVTMMSQLSRVGFETYIFWQRAVLHPRGVRSERHGQWSVNESVFGAWKLGISLPLLLWFLSVCCDSLNVVEVRSFLEYQLRQGCCFLLLFFIQRTNIDKPVFLFSKAFISSCCPISHYHSLHVTCTPTQTHLPCNRELALSIKG